MVYIMIGREFNNFMKRMKWMGLLTAAALPLFSGSDSSGRNRIGG